MVLSVDVKTIASHNVAPTTLVLEEHLSLLRGKAKLGLTILHLALGSTRW